MLGDQAIQLLEAFPGSHELAMALSAQSQIAMLHEHHEDAIRLGERAVALARELGDQETLTHALTNVGTSLVGGVRHEEGRALLGQAHELAVAHHYEDHAARALVNLATTTLLRRRDDPRGPDDVERALAYARLHELDGYVQYMLGVRGNLRLMLDDWPGAEADARASLALGEQPGVSVCPALITLGRLQARRGEPEAHATLDEAWRLAIATGELQRLGPAAVARAEHAWLEDEPIEPRAGARELAARRGDDVDAGRAQRLAPARR